MQTQNATVHLGDGRDLDFCNVMARRAGTVWGNRAIMLAAHYDSVPYGPGAGDDGAAVAALLEVARLLAQTPHRNNLIFLITDAEEAPGQLPGSQAFVQFHPWAKDVGIVLNFDAGGSCGPSIMYETSGGNGQLIELYARAAPHPVCNSLSYEVYKRMPNDTDFTSFRKAGMRGLNFAFIGGVENYHKPTDDVNHLDPRSLRHDGLQALAMTRALADMDSLPGRTKLDAVYFSVLSLGVVRYSQDLAAPLAYGVALLTLLVVIAGVYHRRISLLRLLAALGLMATNVSIVMAACYLLRHTASFRDVDLSVAAFSVGSVILTLPELLCVRRMTVADRLAAALLVWTGLTILTAIWLPGGSYLTVWPTMLATLSLAVRFSALRRHTFFLALVLLILAAPTIVLIAPIIYLACLALGPQLAWLLTAIVVLTLWLLPIRVIDESINHRIGASETVPNAVH